jgi:hypothetical protein
MWSDSWSCATMERSRAGDKLPARWFRRWLIDEKIEQRRQMNNRSAWVQTINSTTAIWWIEKLLQTPVDDYRKLAIWRILIPYLINIRHISDDETYDIVRSWLDKCHSLRRLDFNPNSMKRYNISSTKRGGYLPISLEKLRRESTYLYEIVTSRVDQWWELYYKISTWIL